MAGFIQLNRCETTDDLLKSPECFLLLTQIALRARRTNEGLNVNGLEIGQALIGDFKSIGLSSEKVYRTAKKKLENFNLVAFKGTNRGTIATLLNSVVYDINENDRGEQKGGQGADKGRAKGEQGATGGRTEGGPGATNNNANKEKKENNGNNDKKEIIEGSGDLFGNPVKELNGKKSKTPAAGKKSDPVVVFPWETESFAAAWDNWKGYKAGEFSFKYKTPQSEQAALMELNEKSGGDEATAIKIINQTMAKGWKGFFALKNDNDGNAKQSVNGNNSGSGPGTSFERFNTSFNGKFGQGGHAGG